MGNPCIQFCLDVGIDVLRGNPVQFLIPQEAADPIPHILVVLIGGRLLRWGLYTELQVPVEVGREGGHCLFRLYFDESGGGAVLQVFLYGPGCPGADLSRGNLFLFPLPIFLVVQDDIPYFSFFLQHKKAPFHRMGEEPFYPFCGRPQDGIIISAPLLHWTSLPQVPPAASPPYCQYGGDFLLADRGGLFSPVSMIHL